jgi:NADH-quinone oxidoreductase subunit K
VSIGWYLAVSAMIFAIGAGGVMVKRNPLVILLCLELMLNAANLAFIAFSRMHGGADHDGQVMALIVMVVAACEVTVGLGIIVAMYRRRLPVDVDELRELRG